MSDDRTAPLTGGLAPDVADAPSPGTVLGRYVVLEVVGRGGAGTVVAAYDSILDRKVALKLLHARADDADAAVLREARMLAKVTHPAVVTVYDVGTMDGTPFVSMEFVPGGDLAGGQPSTVDEALPRWIAAGRGLAAAHAAEIVHGDFKPANVLIDDRGQPKVTDFGIATAVEPTPKTPTSTEGGGEVDGEIISDESPGGGETSPYPIRAGTPLYMAPEQLEGASASVRSDVYSLCATLVALIEGRPPWASLGQRLEGAAPVVDRLRRQHAAPPWLVAVLERGLRDDPALRWPTVAAMLDHVELQRRPRRRSTWMLLAAAVPLVAVGAVVMQADGAPTSLCQSGPTALDSVYSDATVAELNAAWSGLEQPGAVRAWSDLHTDLERYADGWRQAYRERCTAAAHDPIAKATLACLRRRATSLGAALEPLAEPTPEIVFGAHKVVEGLPRVETCMDPQRLASSGHEAPPDVAQLIDRSAGLLAGRDVDTAIAVGREAVTAARAHPSLPVLMAEAQLALGTALRVGGKLEEARTLLNSAYFTGLRHEADVAQYAAGELASVVGDGLGRAQEGLIWRTHAEIAERKRGMDIGRSMSAGAALLAGTGDLQASADAQRQALAQLTAEGAQPRYLASSHHRLGLVLRDQGKLDEAREQWTKAAALYRDALGEDHPHLWQTLNGVALLDLANGDVDAAERGLQQVIANLRRILGDDHPDLSSSLQNLAIVHAQTGRRQEALEEFRRAAAILARATGPESLRTAVVEVNVAVALSDMGRPEQALAVFERVLAIYGRELPDDHHERFFAEFGYGAALMGVGRPSDGVAAFERAQAIAAVALPEHLDLPEVEIVLGEAGADAGRPADERRAWFGRALERLGDRPDGESLRARAQAGLQALDSGND